MTSSFDFLERRPIVIAIAEANGSGKSTFYLSHLASSGLRFVNADAIADELEIGAYEAAEIAAAVRAALLESSTITAITVRPINWWGNTITARALILN